jgi:dCTP deaminase
VAFLSKNELEKLLPKQINPFNNKRIKDVAYELSLGDEVYLTDSKTEKKEKLDEKNSQIIIKPGQFALLLTEEIVSVPIENIAFISIKFKEKIKGLVNVSGFHVDPGFSGKIIFSVYNAGPAPIVMDKGKPYFLIWFSELTSAAGKYDGNHQGQTEITADHVAALKGEIASPNVLLDRIEKNENGIKNNWWALGIILSLSIALNLKVFYDQSKFNEGYKFGKEELESKARVNTIIDNINLDSLILSKVDSTLKIKTDTSGKAKN